MDEGTEVDVEESCKECGMKRAVVRSGFLYCVECGMRSAESQPVLDFGFDNFTGTALKSSKRSTKKQNVENEMSNMWSTWHAHNMILLGLVDEVSMCGANGNTLSGIVLRLWSRWLRHNKVAFFSKKHNDVPNLTLGFKPRDLNLLFGFKKRRKKQDLSDLPNSQDLEHSRRSKLKSVSVLLRKEHQEMLDSQTSTLALAPQNLADVTLKTEVKLNEIVFNSTTKKQLKRKMSDEDFDLHIKEGFCSTKCKCFNFRKAVSKNRLNKTSIFNLYALLVLGLRINNDDIHLGDVLRWCREGHLTFGNYKHFFPEDMHLKRTDRLVMSSKLLTHKSILTTVSQFSKAFHISGIKAPNVLTLVKRYIEELELPHELLALITKIVRLLPKPLDYYSNEHMSMPNYEAIALSYIIISIKLLYSLDGVSEHKISESVSSFNAILKLEKYHKTQSRQTDIDTKHFRRLFVLEDWMKYIEYRKVCLSQCHYPTKIRYDSNKNDNPELFLYHHNKMRRTQVDETVKNNCQSIIKSLLQRVEDNYKQEIEFQYPLFSCSLTPMASNTLDLLNWQYLNTKYSNFEVNIDILDEDFAFYNISFLLDPQSLKEALSRENYFLYVHKFSGNEDINVCRINSRKSSKNGNKLKEIITVLNCESRDWAGVLMAEKLAEEDIPETNKLNDSIISISSTKDFSLETESKQTTKTSIDLFLCFENYWTRHYKIKKLSEKWFEKELDTYFPESFAWLLRECAYMAEMTPLCLYEELTKLERQLIDLAKKRCKIQNKTSNEL